MLTSGQHENLCLDAYQLKGDGGHLSSNNRRRDKAHDAARDMPFLEDAGRLLCFLSWSIMRLADLSVSPGACKN